MEFGALDRILYNLINNACRHTAGDVVKLTIHPVPNDQVADLRFVLVNGLSRVDAERLRSWDLSTLFQEGLTTTGSGLGLAIVTEFVSHAYGLPSPGDAAVRRYVGATLLGDSFAAWFHWPKAADRRPVHPGRTRPHWISRNPAPGPPNARAVRRKRSVNSWAVISRTSRTRVE